VKLSQDEINAAREQLAAHAEAMKQKHGDTSRQNDWTKHASCTTLPTFDLVAARKAAHERLKNR